MPVYDGGIASGLFAGILFGYVLEGAGFGSARKLTAQFRGSDWSVVKDMFTAVIVAALLFWIFESFGWITSKAVYIPTFYLYATIVGGVLIGAGFAIGGYCPGTSAAAVASGRLDAVVFIIGMGVGTFLFANQFDAIAEIYSAGKGPTGQTISDLLAIPDLAVIALMIIALIGIWIVANKLEKRLGGPVQITDIIENKNQQPEKQVAKAKPTRGKDFQFN
jgi:hypothetical protein